MPNFVAHVIPLKDSESLHDNGVVDCKCRPDISATTKISEDSTIQIFEHKTIRGFRKYIPWLNWDKVGLASTGVILGYTVNDMIDSGFFRYILGIG